MNAILDNYHWLLFLVCFPLFIWVFGRVDRKRILVWLEENGYEDVLEIHSLGGRKRFYRWPFSAEVIVVDPCDGAKYRLCLYMGLGLSVPVSCLHKELLE